jgi:hypothetical protein
MQLGFYLVCFGTYLFTIKWSKLISKWKTQTQEWIVKLGSHFPSFSWMRWLSVSYKHILLCGYFSQVSLSRSLELLLGASGTPWSQNCEKHGIVKSKPSTRQKAPSPKCTSKRRKIKFNKQINHLNKKKMHAKWIFCLPAEHSQVKINKCPIVCSCKKSCLRIEPEKKIM